MGHFDAVVSEFAIHYLKHERKHILYEDIYNVLYQPEYFVIWNAFLSVRRQTKEISQSYQ